MLGFERLNRRDGGVGGIAIIRAAAAVKLSVEVLRRPGALARAPAIKLRLFV